MRIIGGAKRGLKLQTPKGDTTRPTMDRTRESLVNILQNGKYRGILQGAVCADVFAGSGSVGLEFISQGAKQCTFYESDTSALRVLRANIGALGLGACIVRNDAFVSTPQPVFDIVYMDAPYGLDYSGKALRSFIDIGALDSHTLVLIQVAKGEEIPEIAPFKIQDIRTMAGGKIGFLTV